MKKTHVTRHDLDCGGTQEHYASTMREAVLNLVSLHSQDCNCACEHDALDEYQRECHPDCPLGEVIEELTYSEPEHLAKARDLICEYGNWRLVEEPCPGGECVD